MKKATVVPIDTNATHDPVSYYTHRLIDGHTIEQIAEEFDKSTRQMQRIITRIQTKVFLHLG